MAWHLFGAKPLPEPMLIYCELDRWEQTSVKFESKFMEENAYENVLCKMSAILSQPSSRISIIVSFFVLCVG